MDVFHGKRKKLNTKRLLKALLSCESGSLEAAIDESERRRIHSVSVIVKEEKIKGEDATIHEFFPTNIMNIANFHRQMILHELLDPQTVSNHNYSVAGLTLEDELIEVSKSIDSLS
jgi:hypothetical protein